MVPLGHVFQDGPFADTCGGGVCRYCCPYSARLFNGSHQRWRHVPSNETCLPPSAEHGTPEHAVAVVAAVATVTGSRKRTGQALLFSNQSSILIKLHGHVAHQITNSLLNSPPSWMMSIRRGSREDDRHVTLMFSMPVRRYR